MILTPSIIFFTLHHYKPAGFLKQIVTLLFLAAHSTAVFAQQPGAAKPNEAEHYVKLLSNAKDSLYDEIMRSYDSYISRHQEDFAVQIERCKFLETAYYDTEEDYNPKYEEATECREDLVAAFPDVPEVLIYNSEYQYGDSAIPFLDKVIADFENDAEKWNGKKIWKVYKKLAEIYETDGKPGQVIKNALLAVEYNDTLDISLLLARQYQELKQKEKAIYTLTSSLDSSDRHWELNQKGKLLLELGAPSEAIKAFQLAKKDSSNWVDDESLAQAMIENGLYKEAREYLVKATETYWNKGEKLRKLFEYDIQYSIADSAKATYQKLNEDGFWNDPVGVYRLRLLFSSPLSGWTLNDFLRLLLLLLLLLIIAIFPYTWILPLHYAGNYFKGRGMTLTPTNFRWGLRSFWIASSLALLVNIAAYLLFMYDDFLSDEDITEVVSQKLADMTLFYFTAFFLLTFLFFRKRDLGIFWGTVWNKKKSILKGIGAVLLLRFGLGILIRLFNKPDINLSLENPGILLAIKESIISINQYYHPLIGFLFVVLIVPFYEEILFRGVFTSALEKYMKFWLANILQATAFAAMHLELLYFPFYLAFGIVAGHFRQKSQSLAPGISMHVTNNFLAFLGILRLG
jgi:uncharacterized protein